MRSYVLKDIPIFGWPGQSVVIPSRLGAACICVLIALDASALFLCSGVLCWWHGGSASGGHKYSLGRFRAVGGCPGYCTAWFEASRLLMYF